MCKQVLTTIHTYGIMYIVNKEKAGEKMKLYESNNKAVVKFGISPNKKKTVTIPSNYYPLTNSNYKIFTSRNTTECNDDKIKEIFDSTAYCIAQCFSNADELYKKLTAQNIEAKLWSGWLFIDDDYPQYHCWVTVDNHILDLTNDFAQRFTFLNKAIQNFDEAEISEVRKAFIQFDLECKSQNISNSLRCSPFGKIALDNIIYIGSQCGSGEEAKKVLNDLVKRYPNHKSRLPCPKGSNLTQTQQMTQAALDTQEK